MEKWKQINNLHYEVSNIGNVRNSETLHVLKPSLDRYGYYKVTLLNEGRLIYKTVHRLVAETWLPNPNNLPQVNHEDGVKINNKIGNLEWNTGAQNIIHSYDTFLNKNTNHVWLTDNLTKEILSFRSVKNLAKYLNTSASILMPLIKCSNVNPIFDRYVIEIKNEAAMSTTANNVNFGRPIYVLDILTNCISMYSSIILASYHTGIRMLSSLYKGNDCISKVGYYFSFEKDKLPLNVIHDKETIENERFIYKTTPNRRQPCEYYLYDYYKKEELIFSDLFELALYLSAVDGSGRIISKNSISYAIADAGRIGKTGLIKGFGVKSNLYDLEWFPYKEETILSNKYNFPVPVRAYEVMSGDNTATVIVGMKALCKYLNYCPDKTMRKVKDTEIVEFANMLNLNVRRLSLPIG